MKRVAASIAGKGFFASVGIPGFLAYPVFGIELLGGIALVLGLYARQVSLAFLVPRLQGA